MKLQNVIWQASSSSLLTTDTVASSPLFSAAGRARAAASVYGDEDEAGREGGRHRHSLGNLNFEEAISSLPTFRPLVIPAPLPAHSLARSRIAEATQQKADNVRSAHSVDRSGEREV